VRPQEAAGRLYYALKHDPSGDPLTRLPADAEAYRSLDPVALLFDRIEFTRRESSIVLVLPSIHPVELTAGPVTALRIAEGLGARTGRSLRVVTTNPTQIPLPWHGRALRKRLGDLKVAGIDHVGRGRQATASPSDLWIATSWRTALALTVAARCELVDPARVIYLVQDYEPGFASWSVPAAAARWTYHAGFLHVVNSLPLADYVRSLEGPIVEDQYVMGPDLDLARLRDVAGRRTNEPRRVFLYARWIARNLYGLAVAAAHRAARLTDRPWELVLAGQDMSTPTIPGLPITNLGRTDYEGYLRLMAETQIALSLMMSPHPSHPPLDWATSGGWAVTNAFGTSRNGIHPRLLTADADPDSLGQLLAHTIDTATVGEYLEPRPLGRPMTDVLNSLADRFA
jgi:hypothetical protein